MSIMEVGCSMDKSTTTSIVIGVCALRTKYQTRAKPMQNILSRLAAHEFIKVIVFSDEVILSDPVEDWPICNCLVAFYSDGFPLKKALQYIELREPMVINDLQEQYAMTDRRQVYQTLVENGVEVPKYVIVNSNDTTLVENDDAIEVVGQVFHKPFVEKPVSAKDHNIYIYFPSDYGGGAQRLFKKDYNNSSAYSKESSVRKDGSYIYEEFLVTDGTDVKVYVVGPDYAHAEARKSPALDGKVDRDSEGKVARYPVTLSNQEKLIARRVCGAFKQTIVRFDLLRANGKSYVCDVNAFSFVKNSDKYYDDCAQILLEMVTARLAPHLFPKALPSVEYRISKDPELPKKKNSLELRSVVGVMRHADRTPKQKMKMIVTHWRFIELFRELKGFKNGQVIIKKSPLLQKVLDISSYLLDDFKDSDDLSAKELEETHHKLWQLRTVLEMHGDKKLKLINRNQPDENPQLLLVLKWGGELTLLGQKQAQELGQAFRSMYSEGEEDHSSIPGSGFLWPHGDCKHDLQVYAVDSSRAQMTAAAFLKGLLDLRGTLASVLIHLVKRDPAVTDMLDISTKTAAKEAMTTVKKRLYSILRSNSEFTPHSYTELVPTGTECVKRTMKTVGNPGAMSRQLHHDISMLLDEIRKLDKDSENDNGLLYKNETLPLMINRWSSLLKDFKPSTSNEFNIDKIPNICDSIKYDMLHNPSLHLQSTPNVISCAMPLTNIVIHQGYGITAEDKLDIGKKVCAPLLKKIQADLHHPIISEQADVLRRLDTTLSNDVVLFNRHVKSRFYFTSKGHIHTLVNVLKHGGLEKFLKDKSALSKSLGEMDCCPEFGYLTQVLFLLYEDTSKDPAEEDRFRVDVQFSPGIEFQQQRPQDMCLTNSPSTSFTNKAGVVSPVQGSPIEPAITLCSASLQQVKDFLNSVTSAHSNFDTNQTPNNSLSGGANHILIHTNPKSTARVSVDSCIDETNVKQAMLQLSS